MSVSLILDVLTACQGMTEGRARCREMVQGYGICSRHNHACEAEPPQKVLLKIRLNAKKFEQLEAEGIGEKPRNEAAIRARHVQQAQQHRRDPDAYKRGVPDSGTPVFGSSGAQNVLINEVWDELEEAQYGPVSAHIYRQAKDAKSGMGTLVVEFAPLGDDPTNLTDICRPMFDTHVYKHIHVYVNPPSNGEVVHTVNISHRQESNIAPQARLVWNDGFWGLAHV